MTIAGYLFTYFTGETTPDGEAVRFAVTAGPHLGEWRPLPGATPGGPALTSGLGERGLRDPFVLRGAEGYHLIATDLRIYGGNDFGNAQERGSLGLMVWDSPDLVHWSGERLVRVSPAEAGNSWAPKAVRDPETGDFLLFWASALYPAGVDGGARRIADSYQRIMLARTRDFVHVSEPQVWIDRRRGPGLGMIDTFLVPDGDDWFRFTKDEGVMLPLLERLAPGAALDSQDWELVAERLGEGLPNGFGGVFTQGEGPVVAPAGDGGWYVFIDQPEYHGGQGYVAFEMADLGSGVLTPATGVTLPDGARHGSVLPLDAAEHARLLAVAP